MFRKTANCSNWGVGKDRELFLASALRVLKPNGVFHICTMCGEVICESFRHKFDPRSRCLIYNGIAIRYIGLTDDILAEVKHAGFHILDWEVAPRKDENEQDDLLLAAITF